MAETANIRMERIERLLRDLEYEITRGMMEGEIDENLGFRFIVPVSKALKDGVVVCEFRTRPKSREQAVWNAEVEGPRLRIVK